MLNNRALAASASAPKLYVEDVFSTYLYTGNGTTQTITNGIDLSGKGGLAWVKARTASAASDHVFADTTRGASNYLSSNSTSAQIDDSSNINSFTSSGFSVNLGGRVNQNANNYASWTFRKAAKFFDVVTWVGNGVNNRQISHSLGSEPGFIIVKTTSSTGNWICYHRSLGTGNYLVLSSTQASNNVAQCYPTVTSSYFIPTSDTNAFSGNDNGVSYVAYLFAHDAGGFGDSGNDSIIKCGSFAHGSDTELENLGWEPQWVLVKSTSTGEWRLYDTLRGASTNSSQVLLANSAAAEVQNNVSSAACIVPRATGFNHVQFSFETFIYIAIRRGPMKTPTDATKVFTSITKTAASGQINTSDFPVDLSVDEGRSTNYGAAWFDRLRGRGPYLLSSSTNPEGNQDPTYYIGFDSNTGVFNKNYGGLGGGTYVNWLFRRAPGFFDVVAYSGGGTSKNHNLGVKPELAFIKVRSTSFRNWIAAIQGGTGGYLNTSDPINASNLFVDLSNATSTTFPINGNPEVGQSGQTYIAYLFATCPGVSKVGSYTGTGNSTLNVNCGFTTGARFVLIKRTDSAGDWYVWDSARGLTVSTAPYLLFNSTATEVTGTTYINSISTGFGVSAGSPEIPVNFTGASYIYLAIA